MKNSASVRQFTPTSAKGPQGARKAANPPRSLSVEARRRWRALVEEYGIGDAGGVQILQTAMEAFDRMAGAQRQILKDGQTSTDRFGQIKAHPLLSVERDARSAMLHALKALNLDVEPLHAHPGRPGGGR